ncbi:MAG: glycosyltransferase [Cytophagaceae bacterium]|nr:glycosyltransferase [Cytophagaceae bacterium]MDW8456319.1 glycosyltransferase [Cytophagaceae bacterium]
MNHKKPLVTVICICHNQANYVEECLQSVYAQTYSNIELIVVDNGSTDGSQAVIAKVIKPNTLYFPLDDNIGMCAAFNKGLAHAKGKYIINLAADDVLMPAKIELQVLFFEQQDSNTGVIFSDALLIDENSKPLKTFYKRNNQNQLLTTVPEGYIYEHLLRHYTVSSPTLMVRKSVYDEIGGLDESLVYEDYDFYVRTGKKYKYMFQNEVLIKKRISAGSASSLFYRPKENPFLQSTLIVLNKATRIITEEAEKKSLIYSIRYHMRQSLYMQLPKLVEEYYALLRTLILPSVVDRIIYILSKIPFPYYEVYKVYRKCRVW